MNEQQRTHKISRIGAATAITVAGGTVMIGDQPASAAAFDVDTISSVRDASVGDVPGGDGFLSLADAIYLANNDPDLDTITFTGLGPGPHTIDVAGALPGITEDLIITGPGTDQLTITNSNGSAFYVYNDADVTMSGFTISSPELPGPARAAGIVVDDGGTTTVRDLDIDTVAVGIWVKDLGVGIDDVNIENVRVDDAENSAVSIGDVEMLSVDGLAVTNSALGARVSGTGTATITGLDVTDGAYGLYAVLVDDLDVIDSTVSGATSTAMAITDSVVVKVSGATINDGTEGISVTSFGPVVDSVAISGSTLSGQTGSAIEIDEIDDVDVSATTVDGGTVGVDIEDADTVDMSTVGVSNTVGNAVEIDDATTATLGGFTIDTPGSSGLAVTTVPTVSLTGSVIDEAHDAAVRLINIDEATVHDVTATRTLGGGGSNAGAVFGNGVAAFDLADVTVSGAGGGGLIMAGGGTFTATRLDLTGNENGLRLSGPSGTITESVLSGNTYGGATLADNTDPISITGTDISDNGAGGLYLHDAGPLEADDVTIERNGLVDASPFGGVHFGPDATPDTSKIVDSTISANEGDFGGGVSVDDSDSIVLLHTVTLDGNKGPYGEAVSIRGDVDGGGEINVGNSSITGHTGVASEVFAMQNGLIQMYGTTIEGNSGSSVIESIVGGEVSIQLSEISDNTASAELIRTTGGEIGIATSTVSGNAARTLVEADGSGKVEFVQSTLTQNTTVDSLASALTVGGVDLSFTTMTANSVTDLAGTIFEHDGSGVFRSDSSILSGNSVAGWVDAPLAAPDPEVDYSLIPVVSGTDVDGANNIVTDDPELGPLQDNDGPTLTMLPDKGSPAIDASNPTPPDPPSSDQRGLEREVAGRSDIGSVERQLSPFVIGLPPARVLETRTGPTYKTVDGDDEGIGRRTNGQETTLKIAGRAGVPTDAEAVVINVTGVDPDGVGFVTVHPCLVNPPLASSLNFRGDVDSGNEIVAELTADGELCLFNRGVTDLVVDVVGYVPNNSRYSPVGPARLLDTRDTGATIDGLFQKGGTRLSDTELELDVAGRGGVSSDATAVVINVTAVKPTGIGYVTVHPCLPTEPNAASLNFEAGVNRGNEIVAELNADGKLCLYTWGSAELIVDVVGQLTDENTYDTVPPARLYETRAAPNGTIDDLQEDQGRLTAREVITVEAAGRAGVPADAKGVVVNTTAIRTDNRGFLTVWGCGGTMPLAASLNYTIGEIVGNELVVDLNADGEFCVFSNRATDLTVDVVGYLS